MVEFPDVIARQTIPNVWGTQMTARQPTASDSQPTRYPRVKTANLLLDAENPRLAEYGLGPKAKQFDILKTLWDRMAVAEVAMSIAWNGYFEHEPLFVEPAEKDKSVVIEGNRRLAAVQLLLDVDLRKKLGATDLPDIDRTPEIPKTRRDELAELPCLVTTREQLWRYLGFKHVNGPATWGAYAKAQYVAKVFNEYGVPLEDIARQIGDYNNTVERQYHGLMVVEQAERAGVFQRQNANRKRGFEFSHIYEGLNREGIQQYLGLTSTSRTKRDPVPPKKIPALGELLEWIYGNKAKEIPPRMGSQAKDIEKLSTIVTSEEGIRALRNGLSLDMARDAALGDQQLLRNALNQAKQNLQDAAGLVSTGFDPDDNHALSTADDVEKLATDVYDAMQNKKRKQRRAQREANDDA